MRLPHLLKPSLFVYGLALLAPSQWAGMSVLPFFGAAISIASLNQLQLKKKWACLALIFIGLTLATTGLITHSLATVLIVSLTITVAYPTQARLVCGSLLVATPLFSVSAIFAAQALPLELRLGAPVMLACALLIIFMKGARLPLVLILCGSAALSIGLQRISASPVISGTVCAALFGISLCTQYSSAKASQKTLYGLALAVALHASMLLYASNPVWERMVVWLPDLGDSYEAKFFENYVETLRLVGLQATQVRRAEDIPPKTVVLCPWAPGKGTNDFLNAVKKLPHSSSLTVIVAGEHTNYLGYLEQVNPVLSAAEFNNDTTVPPENGDYMGPVRASSLLPFPPHATLNRGASLSLKSIFATPTIIAEAIFSDRGPEQPDPLWVGDFRLMSSDSSGWTVLAANFREGPVWSLIGDNSFLLNTQIASNPEALMRYMVLASNRPAVVVSWFLLLYAFVLCAISRAAIVSGPQESSWTHPAHLQPIIVLSLFSLCALTYFSNKTYSPSNAYELLRPRWNPFDDRNHSKALVALAPLLGKNTSAALFYTAEVKRSSIGRLKNKEIHIGFPGEETNYGAFKLENCRRFGGLKIPESKIFLMDAQGCRVTGNVEILIGSSEEAVAFSTQTSPKSIFIMDKDFLAGPEPSAANIEFLKSLY